MTQIQDTIHDRAVPDGNASTGRSDRRWRFSTWSGSLTFVVFVLVFVAYSIWLGDAFVSANQRLLDVHQNVPLLLVALGLLVCLVSGQFDLSVGGMATLTTYMTVGLVVKQHLPFALVLLMCLAIGLVGGAVNAFLVIRLRVNAFIATLGTGAAFSGLSTVYSGGTQLAPVTGGKELPSWFSGAGSFGSYQTKVPVPVSWIALVFLIGIAGLVIGERLTGPRRRQWIMALGVVGVLVVLLFATVLNGVLTVMPWTVLFLIGVVFVLWVALRYTTYGRYLYATGGNATAAELAGVRVRRMKSSAFVLSGLLAAVAGIVLAAIQGSASPDIGVGFLLPAFAAVFLSTVMLSTGKFHVWGTVIGGIFLIWVSQGLVIGGVPFTWTGVINGVVLIAAVSLSTALRQDGKR